MAKAANKELLAALRFSARIDSEANVAGAPDISELSLCGRVPPSDQGQVDLLRPVLGFFITLSNFPEVSFEKCSARSRLSNAGDHSHKPDYQTGSDS
jgi:hypothetical protein